MAGERLRSRPAAVTRRLTIRATDWGARGEDTAPVRLTRRKIRPSVIADARARRGARHRARARIGCVCQPRLFPAPTWLVLARATRTIMPSGGEVLDGERDELAAAQAEQSSTSSARSSSLRPSGGRPATAGSMSAPGTAPSSSDASEGSIGPGWRTPHTRSTTAITRGVVRTMRTESYAPCVRGRSCATATWWCSRSRRGRSSCRRGCGSRPPCRRPRRTPVRP
jgi:hypothetical protein